MGKVYKTCQLVGCKKRIPKGKRKYCCDEHFKLARRLAGDPKAKHVYVCANCGDKKKSYLKTTRYCQKPECRSALMKEFNRQRTRAPENPLEIPDWVEGEIEKCCFRELPDDMPMEDKKFRIIEVLRKEGFPAFRKFRAKECHTTGLGNSSVLGDMHVHL